jgi:hypothetical protein
MKATITTPTSHAGSESPVKFKEGSGLQLSAETAAALGLQTGEVETRTVRHTYDLTATVFDAGPPARASSLVPGEIADALEKHPPAEATILAIHRELSAAVTQVEIVFAVAGNQPVGSTLSLALRGPARTGAAVPCSALLRTATGTFVYVVNGTKLLRTPVKRSAPMTATTLKSSTDSMRATWSRPPASNNSGSPSSA